MLTNAPFDEFLRKVFDLSREHASKRGRKLAQLPKEAFQKVLNDFQQRSNNINNSTAAASEEAVHLCKNIIKGSHISIEIESSKIRLAANSFKPQLIPGKAKLKMPGYLRSVEVDCYVACGHWHKLGELKESKINLIDHLEKLLPPKQRGSSKRSIGLITFQNGIMNDFNDEFKKMSQSIIDQFPEGPLCIGLHNPTTKMLVLDMLRFINEPELNEKAVYSFCQMLKTFVDLIPKINPDLVWAHFTHSEGGLIANAVLSLCDQWGWLQDTKKYIKDHLAVATYGAIQPIPDGPVLVAINTYSSKDIALFFGKTYLDKDLDKITRMPYTSTKALSGKTYTITVVESKLPDNPVLKMKLELPPILTVEQRLQMTWFERLGHIPDLESSPYLAYAIDQKIIDTVNNTHHFIDDHGFAEVTYQKTLENNIYDLRKKYIVYDAKTFR